MAYVARVMVDDDQTGSDPTGDTDSELLERASEAAGGAATVRDAPGESEHSPGKAAAEEEPAGREYPGPAVRRQYEPRS